MRNFASLLSHYHCWSSAPSTRLGRSAAGREGVILSNTVDITIQQESYPAGVYNEENLHLLEVFADTLPFQYQ